MNNICLYFQVHQPYYINEVSFFDLGRNTEYFNDDLNKELLNKSSINSYLPACKLFEDLLKSNQDFKFALSFSGVALEQLKQWNPETLKSFTNLIKTGRVEVIAETYYHSLSAFYSKEDFVLQVQKHIDLLKEVFDITPTTFRNTALSYQNEISELLKLNFNFETILTEGVNWSLNGQHQNQLFTSVNDKHNIVLRNNDLSDDIAFRFSDEQWDKYPLMSSDFLSSIKDAEGDFISLFLDLNTIGEYHHKDTGIIEFWKSLITNCKSEKVQFKTPSNLSREFTQKATYNIEFPISWSEEGKDLSTWAGNSLQKEAISKLYNIRNEVNKSKDENLIGIWNKLSSSDHFYYMSSKKDSNGSANQYLNPYRSPYNAYIFYMNVISDLKIRLRALKK